VDSHRDDMFFAVEVLQRFYSLRCRRTIQAALARKVFDQDIFLRGKFYGTYEAVGFVNRFATAE
jgi:hypothetical protein